MHQVPDQLAARMLLLDQALFAGRPKLLIDRPQFDQQAAASASTGFTVQFNCRTSPAARRSSILCPV
jgi:hypothetical protein